MNWFDATQRTIPSRNSKWKRVHLLLPLLLLDITASLSLSLSRYIILTLSTCTHDSIVLVYWFIKGYGTHYFINNEWPSNMVDLCWMNFIVSFHSDWWMEQRIQCIQTLFVRQWCTILIAGAPRIMTTKNRRCQVMQQLEKNKMGKRNPLAVSCVCLMMMMLLLLLNFCTGAVWEGDEVCSW